MISCSAALNHAWHVLRIRYPGQWGLRGVQQALRGGQTWRRGADSGCGAVATQCATQGARQATYSADALMTEKIGKESGLPSERLRWRAAARALRLTRVLLGGRCPL